MSQLRLDPLTGRWVVEALQAPGSEAFAVPSPPPLPEPAGPCPLCPGGEHGPPPSETAPGEGAPRVVPNPNPAFDGDAPMVVSHLGPVFTQAPASGIHQLVVLSPDHDVTWADLDDAGAARVMAAIHDGMEAHARVAGLRCSEAVVSSGRQAGLALPHPHGHLLSTPFVPREITDEQAGFARFEASCLLCTMAEAEQEAGHRLVHADEDAVAVCPFWSGTPFEMLVVPRAHEANLDRSGPTSVAAVGNALRIALRRLRAHLGVVPYDLVFHSAPHRATGCYHWHVHLLPELATAGFQLGTGMPVNTVAPERAAAELRAGILAR